VQTIFPRLLTTTQHSRAGGDRGDSTVAALSAAG
jgi:hypothetical protein